MKLLVLGTRSFAPEIADVASEIPGVEVAGFVENMDRDKCSEELEGLPIYWVDDIASMRDSHVAVCALGTTTRSRFILVSIGTSGLANSILPLVGSVTPGTSTVAKAPLGILYICEV